MMYLTHLSKSEDDNWFASIKIQCVIRFLQRIQFLVHAQKNTDGEMHKISKKMLIVYARG